MNKPKKRYSISTTFENPLSANNPSQISNLKKLNANILNYIKLKGIKYHNISSSTLDQDSGEKKEKFGNIHTIKEENEENTKKDDKTLKGQKLSPIDDAFSRLVGAEKTSLGRNYRSNSQKLYKRNKLSQFLLESTDDTQKIKNDKTKEDNDNYNLNVNINKSIKDNNQSFFKRKSKSMDYAIEENIKKKIPINLEKSNLINLEINNKSKRRSVIGIPKEDENKSKTYRIFLR